MSRLIRQCPTDAMPSGLASGDRSSVTLPFLPTLVTALVVAGASFLCREPAQDRPAQDRPAPAVEQVLVIDPQAYPEPAAPPPGPRAPAALAFAQAYPLLPAEPRATASRPAPRIAAMPPRRPPCLRCEATPRRPEPVLAARPAEAKAWEKAVEPASPDQAEAEAEESLLPDLALPFAPTLAPAARAAGRAADLVRTGAAALGGSVSVLVDRLR
ncbi:hypothetical protein [Methylobacterium planeticum]|uniref:Uncharacterized protein n=1 Tax=Methylobacterium planeticum TaxID=2615211 RepID=A0A6N6MNN8_9HYPH|nr:hypothetical protein [Methylobacterium planeticum]KAB1071796.1 hypothetical protein F6X51_18485 [Methylobacterium planeticum]